MPKLPTMAMLFGKRQKYDWLGDLFRSGKWGRSRSSPKVCLRKRTSPGHSKGVGSLALCTTFLTSNPLLGPFWLSIYLEKIPNRESC